MATMKDIIQSPLLALFGSMALGLFASSASGSKAGAIMFDTHNTM